MILTRIEEIKEGDVLAKDIFDASGNILLRGDKKLNISDIKKLKRYGITNVYLKMNKIVRDKSIVRDDVKKVAVNTAKKCVETFYKSADDETDNDDKNEVKLLDESEIINLVDNIINDIFSKDDLFISLRDIRKLDDQLFFHLTNTSILSIAIAKILNYSKDKLKVLGLGAFLHDIGKIKVPDRILNKDGELSDEEFAEIQKHPTYSYEILKDYEAIPEEVAIIVHQHHEKCNGSGYPQGLKGDDMHPLAKIVAIADVFDALQNNRVYRKGLENKKVINILSSMAEDGELDSKIVNKLSNHILPFPVGARIRLYNDKSNNLLEGVVIDVSKNIQRPVVQAVKINNRKYDMDLVIDLEEEMSNFEIREVV
ncbi:HD-GYP domain-containing protein [Fuchsiella alkaliacetigena]|uniref:HD-GYP domain-containing protein n=1 Tax=Fuchsiella alkaliacetigena TaxID=957042 RepID=UPI00200B7CFE|nr:HD-GYP domain-containing protein [Fuchsiella alkaliacetigena]MCK8825948.1 HD-GYP domain-containing protein [Fuchsiella alkaliacetigena]